MVSGSLLQKNMQKILGIDPGPWRSGWFLWYWYSQERILVPYSGGYDPKEAVDIQLQQADIMVIESFVVYPRRLAKNSGEPIRTSENIGRFKLLCEQRPIPWFEYRAADHKRISDSFMRSKGIKIYNPHARDAARVALWHLIKKEAG